jgi:agmatine deiminase
MSDLHTPSALGYRMPAEWAPHLATWLTWPRPDGISFPDGYEPIPDVYGKFIFHLTHHEEVHINVWDEAMREAVEPVLRRHHVPSARVHFHEFQSYEPWCRDHGPIFVVRDVGGRRDRAVVDWDYNAWGGKYPPHDLDDAVPRHVAKFRGLPLFSPGIIMEGGSLDVNGEGAVLVTESCLLNPNRNPNLNRGQIEQHLRDQLGVREFFWLGDGIVGDDTDGHVDDLARFVSHDTVVTIVEEDPADENFAPLQENLKRLKSFRFSDGRPLNIVPLPTPGVLERDGQRLPASYANFYIANGIVVVPTFRHANDAVAVETLQGQFSTRKVIGLDSSDLIWGLGSFHCISQQEPA